MKHTKHLRALSSAPQAAQQTNFQFKLDITSDFISATSALLVGIQRGLPWGVVFDNWFDLIDGNTSTTN
ncbi:MAG: hypothetical protein JXO22_04700 [Phycisphaerae bacterium]|nr:hypothetical protein [Phycisphaerae bacterium]